MAANSSKRKAKPSLAQRREGRSLVVSPKALESAARTLTTVGAFVGDVLGHTDEGNAVRALCAAEAANLKRALNS